MIRADRALLTNPERGKSPSRKRRHRLDLDQHFWIWERLHHASGARGVGRWSEGPGIERVHGRNVGRPRQQYVDLDEIAQACARLSQHALDIFDDKPELSFECVRERAIFIEPGNARDEEQVAYARRKG